MDKKTCQKVLSILEQTFPDAKPELNFTSNYELLVAVILSAQCTDKRVNMVTEKLFSNYNTPQKMVTLSHSDLAEIIKPCGLNNSKAKHILSASLAIIEKFGGQVPENYEDLITLDGVGRKTANVVSAVAFNKNAIAVDTHVFRVSNRIGLAVADNPYKCEMQLREIIREDLWGKAHHLLIFLGRRICMARNPKCSGCPIKDYCSYGKIVH